MRRIVIPKKIKYNGINFVVSIIGKNIIPGAAKKIKIIQIDSTTIKKVKRNNFAKKKDYDSSSESNEKEVYKIVKKMEEVILYEDKGIFIFNSCIVYDDNTVFGE